MGRDHAQGVLADGAGGAEQDDAFPAGGGDNHRMWIDPANPSVVFTASDQGFTMTNDGGKTKKEATGIHGTQFYNVELDMAKPFHAYGSVQDAGSYRTEINIAPALSASKGGRGAFAPQKWEGAPGGELDSPVGADGVHRPFHVVHDLADAGFALDGALFGLTRALEAQGKTAEAAAVRVRFEKAWARADTRLTSSRVLAEAAVDAPGHHGPPLREGRAADA